MSVTRIENFDGSEVNPDPYLDRSDMVFGPNSPPIHPTDAAVRSLPDDYGDLKAHIIRVSRWAGVAWKYINERRQDIHDRDEIIARLTKRLADAERQIAALAKVSP